MYKCQAQISGKYRPVIVRGRALHEQPPKSCFPEKRRAGETSLDLWWDGSIYPVDPTTNKRPRFRSLKELLEFVGDGEQGLFGYVKHLESVSGSSSSVLREREQEISLLRERINELIASYGRQQGSYDRRIEEVSAEFQLRIDQLQSEVSRHRSAFQDLMICYDEQRRKLSEEKEAKERFGASHAEELQVIRGNLENARRDVQKLQSRMQKMVKTPFGYRQQVRSRRDISTLVQTGGHAKAMRRLARTGYCSCNDKKNPAAKCVDTDSSEAV